jgi:hypothetical protein
MSAGALAWHLTQSALVSATAGLAAGAADVAAGSAATATDASRSSADAKDTILFILSPLFMMISAETAKLPKTAALNTYKRISSMKTGAK